MNNEDINKALSRMDRELASLRGLIEATRGREITSCGIKWSMFERELVEDKLVDAVNDCIMKTSRTRISIKWEMYRHLREQLIGK